MEDLVEHKVRKNNTWLEPKNKEIWQRGPPPNFTARQIFN